MRALRESLFRSSFYLYLLGFAAGIFVTIFAQAAPIYGEEDNRKDLYEVTNQNYLKWADSVVGLYPKDSLRTNEAPGTTRIKSILYSDIETVCKGTRFENQQSAAFCSGVLVARDLVLTAGHCVRTLRCDEIVFAFGNAKKSEAEVTSNIVLKNSEIYGCKRVVTSQFTPTPVSNHVYDPSPAEPAPQDDFALVQLSRPVAYHEPVKVSGTDPYRTETPLVAIGHPHGLPLKVTDEGYIASSRSDDVFFKTDLDLFSGNSGSPIFNANTGEVIGLVSRGAYDMAIDPSGKCEINRRIPSRHEWNSKNGFTGEQVSKTSAFYSTFIKWAVFAQPW